MNLHEFLDQEEQIEDERFKVTDDEKANWALRKVKQFEDRKKENFALAEAEISKVEEWLEIVNADIQNSIEYFQSLLAEYAFNLKKQDPKMKTVKLPNGNLSFRKQQPQWNLDDETVLQALKKSNRTDLIKVTEKPMLADIKKVFVVVEGKAVDPDTGEVVEGITIEERQEKFGVKVND